ncbi:MAG: hypothetical protein ACOYM9_04340 [Bradymonadia bacterium]
MNRAMLRVLVAVGLVFSACGDDAESDGPATPDAGDGGGQPPVGGGDPPADTLTAYQWETLSLTAPLGDSGTVLGTLFTDGLRKREIILVTRLSGSTPGTFESGSARRTEGSDTPEDPADDVFEYYEAGDCTLPDGTVEPCTFDVHRGALTTGSDGWRSEARGFVYVYHTVYKMVVRLKNLELAETRAGCSADVCGTFAGAVSESDAALTVFNVVTDDPSTRTDLKTFLSNFGTTPDTTVPDDTGAMVPAYSFAGAFEAFEVGFDAGE